MNKINIGIVADDFTGASDAASFLSKQGIKTILYNGIPSKSDLEEKVNAIVIALKTRTEEKNKAIKDSERAFEWLEKNGAKQFYFKYCSTFDSTKDGNIGPVIDRILEKYNIKYTVIAPALPVNGRVVKNGHLIINGVPLNETHMRHHPLTPMWDSDLEKLMEPQGKYPALKIKYNMLERSNWEIREYVETFGEDKNHFYVIPDYENDEHARKIVELFGHLPFLTGGSGLVAELGRKYRNSEGNAEVKRSGTYGKAIILSGSCSAATLQQIETFKRANVQSFKIDPFKIMKGTQTKESLWDEILSTEQDAVLVYSSDEPDKVKEAQKAGKVKVAKLLEQTIAYIAKKATENGFNRIIVAGGETSGAVTKILGYESYLVGESIAPGVPIMIPVQNDRVRLVLKSGNFGSNDFFLKAVKMTKEDSK